MNLFHFHHVSFFTTKLGPLFGYSSFILDLSKLFLFKRFHPEFRVSPRSYALLLQTTVLFCDNCYWTFGSLARKFYRQLTVKGIPACPFPLSHFCFYPFMFCRPFSFLPFFLPNCLSAITAWLLTQKHKFQSFQPVSCSYPSTLSHSKRNFSIFVKHFFRLPDSL